MNQDNFVKKPNKGWHHSDDAIQDGIKYNIKYIGCITVNESMKSLSFEVRTQVARESIRRVAESAHLLSMARRNRRRDDHLNAILSNNCNTQWSGMSVQLLINTQFLRVTQTECKDVLFQHTMQNISFACGGDNDIKDFIAYVAKDEINGRACYVFECANNLANDVITTVGQAFELRFKKFINSMHNSNSGSTPNGHPVKSNGHRNGGSPNSSDDFGHSGHHEALNSKETRSGGNQKGQINKKPELIGNGVSSHQNNRPQNRNNHIESLDHNMQGLGLSNHQNFHHHHQENSGTRQGGGGSSGSKRIDEKLERMPWYHGLLTRESAEKLLLNNGDFLVRETNKVESQYVLSGRYKGECRHIFLVDPSGVVRTKDRTFDNICHLIQYHQENRIPIISKENELLLERPICRS